MEPDHAYFMRLAVEEAGKAQGRTDPNPIVGALIVEGGVVVAKAHHAKAGEAHAEINAIRSLGRAPREDAVLYVTLEPCSTHGKTGACTEAIIRAGFQHVVFGATDPNPVHNGRAVKILREAGIKVESGIMAGECEGLNPAFNARMKERQ